MAGILLLANALELKHYSVGHYWRFILLAARFISWAQRTKTFLVVAALLLPAAATALRIRAPKRESIIFSTVLQPTDEDRDKDTAFYRAKIAASFTQNKLPELGQSGAD